MIKINILDVDDFLLPYDIKLDIDDFDFEIIEIGKDYYDWDTPFTPRQRTKVRVNRDVFIMNTEFNDGLIEDLHRKPPTFKEKTENIKFEAVLIHINKNKKLYLRKLKLEKINKCCGD